MRTSRAKSSFAAYATSQGRALGLKQVLVLVAVATVGVASVLLLTRAAARAPPGSVVLRPHGDADVDVLDTATSDEATGTMVGPRPRLPATWPDPDLLARVAIAGRLVVAAVNCGYLDFVDNWLSSLKALKITNYVLIALDLHAYGSPPAQGGWHR